jgi:hypothetical protein
MNMVLAQEFVVGVSGTVLLIERHEGCQQADQYLATGKDILFETLLLSPAADFRPATDLQPPFIG